jgi:hypothetical protein
VALNALFRQGIDTAYGEASGAIYDAYRGMFAALPLAVRTLNRVFLCHTIPDPPDLDRFDPSIFDVETWPAEAMARRGSVYAITWGRDTEPETVDRFAEIVDADWFITGHQPCDEGYRKANHRQIIVDGTDPYPAYCLFTTHEPTTIEALLNGVHVFSPAD